MIIQPSYIPIHQVHQLFKNGNVSAFCYQTLSSLKEAITFGDDLVASNTIDDYVVFRIWQNKELVYSYSNYELSN